MTNDEFFEYLLKHGNTDGSNIPFMPEGKLFVIGYNPKYGLLDVVEKDNGDPYFESRVNIETLLSELQSRSKEEADSRVYDYIMKSYHNLWDYRKNPEKYDHSPTPILEVLTDKSLSNKMN